MQSVVGQQKGGTLVYTQPVMNEVQITLLVPAVEFIPYHRVSKVREMNADLMFAARHGLN